MSKPITAFVPYSGNDFTRHTVEHLRRSGLVDKIADRQAFEARLAELGGEDEDARGGFKRIKLDAYVADRVEEPQLPCHDLILPRGGDR